MSDTETDTKTTPLRLFKINTKDIKVLPWPTPDHKIKKAFSDGKKHAVNHWHGEEADRDWPFGVKSWSVNPYNASRPAVFHSWIAGFSEQWAELLRQESNDN